MTYITYVKRVKDTSLNLHSLNPFFTIYPDTQTGTVDQCFLNIFLSISFYLCLAFSQDTLYPFGPAHRDLETPKMDDGSSPEIPLLIPFIFFNVPYRSLYVSVQNMNKNCEINHQKSAKS